MTSCYYPTTNPNLWSGRTDADDNEYVYQIIQALNLNDAPKKLTGYAFLSFQSDTGVVRNQGSPGAYEGPNAIRRTLAKFPIHSNMTLYDAGNIICIANDLETAQVELGIHVAKIIACGLTPIVLGGGHETAWGHFQGLAHTNKDIAILNFDAHFDLRPLINDQLGSSGTPFRQIQGYLALQNKPFHYYCAGIQPFSNTKHLFDYAHRLNVHYTLAETINANPYDVTFIKNIIDSHQHIYVSICLDVFNASIAPGVSAPQILGIFPNYVIESLKLLKSSGKVIILDIVELAPNYDIRDQTAKLAASLLMTFLSSENTRCDADRHCEPQAKQSSDLKTYHSR